MNSIAIPTGIRTRLLAVLPQGVDSVPGPVSFEISTPSIAAVHVHNSRVLPGSPYVQATRLRLAAGDAERAGHLETAAHMHMQASSAEREQDDPLEAEIEPLAPAGVFVVRCRTGELEGVTDDLVLTSGAAELSEPIRVQLQ